MIYKTEKRRSNGLCLLFSHFQDQIENEWCNIEAVFTAVIAIVETAQARALQPLKDRKQTVEKEAKDLTGELQAEINRLEKTISELDDISALEDHILFLQVRGNITRLDHFHLMCSMFNR